MCHPRPCPSWTPLSTICSSELLERQASWLTTTRGEFQVGVDNLYVHPVGLPSLLARFKLLSDCSCLASWPSTPYLKEPRLSPSTPALSSYRVAYYVEFVDMWVANAHWIYLLNAVAVHFSHTTGIKVFRYSNFTVYNCFVLHVVVMYQRYSSFSFQFSISETVRNIWALSVCPLGWFLLGKVWNFKFCMLPNCSHLLTDFRTVFVNVLRPFLPMFA